ncbi:transposase [Streptomyces tauricus]
MTDAQWAVVRDALPVPAWMEGRGGKKINGRRRHVITDSLGLLLMIWVTAANVTDRQAARAMLPVLRTGSGRSLWCGPTAAAPAVS